MSEVNPIPILESPEQAARETQERGFQNQIAQEQPNVFADGAKISLLKGSQPNQNAALLVEYQNPTDPSNPLPKVTIKVAIQVPPLELVEMANQILRAYNLKEQ